MTLPVERTRAVLRAEKAIIELMPYVIKASKGGSYVRIEPDVLLLFHGVLKHYPTAVDLDFSADLAPDIWGKP